MLHRDPAEAASGAWHFFTDPVTLQPALYVMSPATAALEHVAALGIRAGLAPVLLGSSGCGKSTTLRHLLATNQAEPLLR